jgi:hypothetical protein
MSHLMQIICLTWEQGQALYVYMYKGWFASARFALDCKMDRSRVCKSMRHQDLWNTTFFWYFKFHIHVTKKTNSRIMTWHLHRENHWEQLKLPIHIQSWSWYYPSSEHPDQKTTNLRICKTFVSSYSAKWL